MGGGSHSAEGLHSDGLTLCWGIAHSAREFHTLLGAHTLLGLTLCWKGAHTLLGAHSDWEAHTLLEVTLC